MAINGNICIFRLTSGAGTTETAVTDKIEFDTSATNGVSTQPDARSHIETYKVILSLVTQENPNPNTNNPNSLQDTGLAVVEYELTGFFDSTVATASAIEDFRDWLTTAKTDTAYPFGRFGIRNDQRDEIDVVPQTTQGLMLEHFETNDEYEYTGRTGFTVRLRFNGDISGLG